MQAIMNDALASGLCYGHTVSGLGLSLSSNYVQYHYTITRRGEFLYSERKAGIKKTLPLNGKLVFKDKDAPSDGVIAVKGHGPVDVAVHLKLKAFSADGKDLLGVVYLCFDKLLELENFLGGVLYSCENHNLIGLFKTDAKRRLVANAIAEPPWQMGLDNHGFDSDNEQDDAEGEDSFQIDILGTLSAGVSGMGSGLKNVGMFAQRRIGSMGIMHANKDFQKHKQNAAKSRRKSGFIAGSFTLDAGAGSGGHEEENEQAGLGAQCSCGVEVPGARPGEWVARSMSVNSSGLFLTQPSIRGEGGDLSSTSSSAPSHYDLEHVSIVSEASTSRPDALRLFLADTSVVLAVPKTDLKTFLVTLSKVSAANNIMGFIIQQGLDSDFEGVMGEDAKTLRSGISQMGAGVAGSPGGGSGRASPVMGGGGRQRTLSCGSEGDTGVITGLSDISSHLIDMGGGIRVRAESFMSGVSEDTSGLSVTGGDGSGVGGHDGKQQEFLNTKIKGVHSLDKRLKASTKTLDLAGWVLSCSGDDDAILVVHTPKDDSNGSDVGKVKAWLMSSANSHCKSVDMAHCGMDGSKLQNLDLFKWTCQKRLHALDLSHNQNLGIKGMACLTNALHMSFRTVRELDLSHCMLGDRAANHMAYALASRNPWPCPLESLDLSYCDLTKAAAATIAGAVSENAVLKVLNLAGNLIGPSGAREFAVALASNATLEVLNVNNQQLKIGPEGAIQLSRLLRIPTSGLKVLCIAHNDIGFEGCRHLSGALLVNTTLYELDLGGINYITMGGARQLGQAIVHNVTLEWLTVGTRRLPLSVLKGREIINEHTLGKEVPVPPESLDLTLECYVADDYGVSYSGMHDEMAIVVATCLQDNIVAERNGLAVNHLKRLRIRPRGEYLNIDQLSGRDVYNDKEIDLSNVGFDGVDAIVIGGLLLHNKFSGKVRLDGNYFASSEGENWIASAIENNRSMNLDFAHWPVEQIFIDGYKTLASMKGMSASGAHIEPQRLEGCFYVFLTKFAALSFYVNIALDVNAVLTMTADDAYRRSWVVLYCCIICIPTMLLLEQSLRLFTYDWRSSSYEAFTVIFQFTALNTVMDAVAANMETSAYLDHKYVNGVYRTCPLIVLQFYIIFSVLETTNALDLSVAFATVLSLFGVTVIYIMIYDRKEARRYSMTPRSNQPACAVWLADWLTVFGMGTADDEDGGLAAFVNFDAFYTSHYVWSWIYQFLCLNARVLAVTWLLAGLMNTTVEDDDDATYHGSLALGGMVCLRSIFIIFLEPYKPGEEKSRWRRLFSHKEGGVRDALERGVSFNDNSDRATIDDANVANVNITMKAGAVNLWGYLPQWCCSVECWDTIKTVLLPMLSAFDSLFAHIVHSFELTISDGCMHRNDDHPHECLNLWWALSTYTALENIMAVGYMAYVQPDPSLPMGARNALFITVLLCVVFRAVLFVYWLRYVHFQSIFAKVFESDQLENAAESAKRAHKAEHGSGGAGTKGKLGGTDSRSPGGGAKKMRRRSGTIDFLQRGVLHEHHAKQAFHRPHEHEIDAKASAEAADAWIELGGLPTVMGMSIEVPSAHSPDRLASTHGVLTSPIPRTRYDRLSRA